MLLEPQRERGDMDTKPGDGSIERNRLLMLAALVAGGAVTVGVAIGTGVLKIGGAGTEPPTADTAASQQCQTDVMKRLIAPQNASLADLHTESSSLDVDGRDLFPLTQEDPLKGVDTGRINVLNVSGVVNAKNEVGGTIQDHFNCRAYFVDGALAHTLVLLDEAH